MKDRTALGTPNQRRANRIAWERPVRLLSPVPVTGESVNVSACGILVRLGVRKNLRRGARVAIEIPRIDGMASVLRHGRVVRVESLDSGMTIAIELV